MDDRIKKAALEVYADGGWTGFTFEAVARRARVGKPAIYLRWSDRADLLIDTFDTIDIVPSSRAAATCLRDDLLALCRDFHHWWRSTDANAWLHLQLDQRTYPELRQPFHERTVARNVAATVDIVDRALARGELASRGDGVRLLEMLNGAVFTHIITAGHDAAAADRERADQYLESLVDLGLAAVARRAGRPACHR